MPHDFLSLEVENPKEKEASKDKPAREEQSGPPI
jgi:hypothetical protein